jgi:hypothetical protein
MRHSHFLPLILAASAFGRVGLATLPDNDLAYRLKASRLRTGRS